MSFAWSLQLRNVNARTRWCILQRVEPSRRRGRHDSIIMKDTMSWRNDRHWIEKPCCSFGVALFFVDVLENLWMETLCSSVPKCSFPFLLTLVLYVRVKLLEEIQFSVSNFDMFQRPQELRTMTNKWSHFIWIRHWSCAVHKCVFGVDLIGWLIIPWRAVSEITAVRAPAGWLSHVAGTVASVTRVHAVRVRVIVHVAIVQRAVIREEPGPRFAAWIGHFWRPRHGLGVGRGSSNLLVGVAVALAVKTVIVIHLRRLRSFTPATPSRRQRIVRVRPVFGGRSPAVRQTLKGPGPCVHSFLFRHNFVCLGGLISHLYFDLLILVAGVALHDGRPRRLRALVRLFRTLVFTVIIAVIAVVWIIVWITVSFTVWLALALLVITIFDNYITWNDTKEDSFQRFAC